MKRIKSKKKITFIIMISIIILVIVGWWILTISIYNENFNKRFESYEPFMLHVDDFNELQCEEYQFFSDNGQILAGYMYSSGENQRGIVIMAHGFGGGGHNSYMDCANYFAQHGYFVFAYDATGNDKSEGAGVGGIPQGVIDLDCAISFVEASGNFPDFPIVLFGHSWGGYSVCSVLTYHPEVKAVISCSGCNSSADIFEAGGKSQVGNLIYTMMPFVKIHEWVKYGKYASNTAIDGFVSTDAAVMIVHSSDDEVVPIEYGYDMYYKKYKDDPRFTFLRFDDRGHNGIVNDPNNTYKDEFNLEFDKWLESLDYDYLANENKERFMKDKAEYINDNLDRMKWSNRLDIDLFEQFLAFYDYAIQQ